MSLITLQQLDPIFVDFPVPEKSFDLLKPGQAIEVEIDTYPGQIFRGVIKTVDARIALDSRNVLVRGQLDNKKRQLWSGMFANVNVIAGAPQKVVTLPRTAVTYSLYGESVFVVKPFAPDIAGAQAAQANEDEVLKIERRAVRAGDTREDRVAIVEGVRARRNNRDRRSAQTAVRCAGAHRPRRAPRTASGAAEGISDVLYRYFYPAAGIGQRGQPFDSAGRDLIRLEAAGPAISGTLVNHDHHHDSLSGRQCGSN